MTDSIFMEELERFGPRSTPWDRPTAAQAISYCRNLARKHYENFTVGSWLLPRHLRQHFYSIYAYCRWADDFADEVCSQYNSLDLLDWWEDQLHACYRGEAQHPVFVALSETVAQFDIPRKPFCDLLIAFRRDQQKQRYATFDELLEYCRYSANPVGRIILYLGNCHVERNWSFADSLCTGLQLTNLWQDVARDFDRNRIYIPIESWQKFGYSEAQFQDRVTNESFRQLMAFEVDRAESYLRQATPLVELVPPDLRIDIDLFLRGGLTILTAIRRINFDIWEQRPTVSSWEKTRLLLAVWWGTTT